MNHVHTRAGEIHTLKRDDSHSELWGRIDEYYSVLSTSKIHRWKLLI